MGRSAQQVGQLKARFLEEFRQRGNISDTVHAIGIGRMTVYRWREADPAFAEQFQDAIKAATDLLDGEARHRAMGEVQVPVFHQGEVVGHIPRYTDKLLMFLLRARCPEIYREGYERRAGHSHRRPADPLAAVRAILDGPEPGPAADSQVQFAIEKIEDAPQQEIPTPNRGDALMPASAPEQARVQFGPRYRPDAWARGGAGMRRSGTGPW